MMTSTDFHFLTHADRLFIELGRTRILGKRGLPATPSAWNEVAQQTWDHWDDVPCVILLGEPGSGKTREFRHQFDQSRASGFPAFVSRWQDWCVGDDVFVTLNDRNGFFAAIKSGQTVWWFIDALDEGRIRTESAFDVLRKGLRELQVRGELGHIKLRLSCRSRDWRPSEASQLAPLFPDLGSGDETVQSVVTLQLLPLEIGRASCRERV